MKKILIVLMACYATIVSLHASQPYVFQPGSYVFGPNQRVNIAQLQQLQQPQQQQQQQPPQQPPLQQFNMVPQPESTHTPLMSSGNPETLGRIKIQGECDTVPSFRILFDGKTIMNNKEGIFSFPIEEKNIHKFSLVICKKIKQEFDKNNTLKGIDVIPDKNYRYFTFKKNPWGGEWFQHEKTLNKKNFQIPEHCAVALIDPKYVERIEEWNIQTSPNVLKLPLIVLKQTASKNTLNRLAAKSLLYSLETTVFHEPIKEEIKIAPQNPKVAMSLMQ